MNDVHFTIAGKRYTDTKLLVVIPVRYRKDFEGLRFADMHEFSQTMAIVDCANEAAYYGKAEKFARYDGYFKSFLRKQKGE